MYTKATLTLLALCATVIAKRAKLQESDVPDVCLANVGCATSISYSSTCDHASKKDDAYLSCYCGSPKAENLLDSCADCVYKNIDSKKRKDDAEEVNALLAACGWHWAPAPVPTTLFTSTTKSVTVTYTSEDKPKTTSSDDHQKSTSTYTSEDKTKTTSTYTSEDKPKTTSTYTSEDKTKTTSTYTSEDNTKTTSSTYTSEDKPKTTSTASGTYTSEDKPKPTPADKKPIR